MLAEKRLLYEAQGYDLAELNFRRNDLRKKWGDKLGEERQKRKEIEKEIKF